MPPHLTELAVGSNSWLLKETRGCSFFDKLVLDSFKIIFLGARILLRIILGKRRRDRLWNRRGITFSDFLYKSIEFLHLDNSLLIVFSAPKYNFRFCSRITRKVENFLIHDMHISMYSHEDDIVKHFCPKGGDIVIDVGAAFGFYTILSSRKVGVAGKIVAIEPSWDNFEILNRNLKLNKLRNVITLNYAAYSKQDTLNLYSSYSTLPQRAGKKMEKFVQVRANTLDNLLEPLGISKVNWMKIDVEGAEYEVLKGARNILSNSKDISLLIEIHNLDGGTDFYDPIIAYLESYNFKIEVEKRYEEGHKHIIARKLK
jgi:FkbM family methyltransferase